MPIAKKAHSTNFCNGGETYGTNGSDTLPGENGLMPKIDDVQISRGAGIPFLVFDVGGSHVSAAACLGRDFRLGPVASRPYPDTQTGEAFVEFLRELGAEAESGDGRARGATLAVPGPFDLKGGVSLMRHKLPFLYGLNLRKAVADGFGWTPEHVDFLNDADAFLLGEVGAGAARGFRRAVGITLGTGVGSAFAVDGRLTSEGEGVPHGGEIWNLPYEGGIVEDFVSARAIRRFYQERTGNTREVVELAAATAHDPAAQQSFIEFGQHLGRVLDRVLASFSPEVVVVGGAISKSASLFLPVAKSQLREPAPQLRVSELFDRAPLVGCSVARLSGGNGSPLSVGLAQNRSEAR
jgi:glucokinase